MRIKKFTEQHMVRLSLAEKRRLEESAERLGINAAELTRIALRLGLPLIERKLPVMEPQQ